MQPPNTNTKKQYTAIPLRVIVFLAWRDLVSKKLRTSLTVLGVIIGIGAIFFLLSLGLGLQKLVTTEVIGNQSLKSIDITSPNPQKLPLDQESVKQIEQLPNAEVVGASYSFAGTVRVGNSETDTIVYGVDRDYQELSNLSPMQGRLISDREAKVTVINRAVLDSVGISDPQSALGKALSLKISLPPVDGQAQSITDNFQIIGVVDSGAGSEVYIPGEVLAQAGITQYSQVKVRADTTQNISSLRQKIESLGFTTSSPIDTVYQINRIFSYFNIALVGFGLIGMIVAVLGMFNTLTISLLERTKEIGLMLALGARRTDMRRLFVLEAVLLSVLGSAIGIALAILLGNVTNFILNMSARGRGVTDSFSVFVTPVWLIIALIVFMVFVGLIVVFLPARRAERINPIDALRRE